MACAYLVNNNIAFRVQFTTWFILLSHHLLQQFLTVQVSRWPMVVMSVRVSVFVASRGRGLGEACARLLVTEADGLNVLKTQ